MINAILAETFDFIGHVCLFVSGVGTYRLVKPKVKKKMKEMKSATFEKFANEYWDQVGKKKETTKEDYNIQSLLG